MTRCLIDLKSFSELIIVWFRKKLGVANKAKQTYLELDTYFADDVEVEKNGPANWEEGSKSEELFALRKG